jgi:hypothetical protein
MKRIAPYFASATLGIAMLATNPAAAQIARFGIDIGYPAYPSYSAYPSYYSRIYGYPYGYASPRYAYYDYPYAFSAWNYRPDYDWDAAIRGIGSLAAAPFEVAGAAVTTPFEVAANTQAPLVTGRSVAVEPPYYASRMSPTRHAYYPMRHMNYGRRAYIRRANMWAPSAQAPLVTGRSVAVEEAYYGRRMSGTRHAYYHMRHMNSRHAYHMRPMNYGRSAYIRPER